MPEISEAEYRQFVRYQSLGTPEDLERLPKKISDLEADNKQQRDEIRALKETQPAEGHVVIPKEKADALEKYEAIGTPDELANVASERDELRQKDAARTRQDQIRAAVEAAGWPAETVATLEDMRSLDGASFEVRTETVDGEQVRTPYVKLADDGAEPQKLTEFAANAPQLRGLKIEKPEEQDGGGTPWIEQQGRRPPPKDGKKQVLSAIAARDALPWDK